MVDFIVTNWRCKVMQVKKLMNTAIFTLTLEARES